MCLAIPMRIVEITGFNARCEAKGIERTVSLFLMQHEPLAAGDIVMVHVGYAIQRMTEDEARSAWELYDEMLAAEAGLDEAELDEAGHDEDDLDKDGGKERAAADHA